MDPSGTRRSTERLGQEPAGRVLCRSALGSRGTWGKNGGARPIGRGAAAPTISARPRLAAASIWRSRADTRGRATGGERLPILAFFPSPLSRFSPSFCCSPGRTREATAAARCGCAFVARIIAAVVAAVAFLTYPPSVGGQPDPLIPPKTIADGSGGGGGLSGVCDRGVLVRRPRIDLFPLLLVYR